MNKANEAHKKGADAYVIKPVIDTDAFLRKIKEYLRKQEESEHYSEEKVSEFVETRIKRFETAESEKPGPQ